MHYAALSVRRAHSYPKSYFDTSNQDSSTSYRTGSDASCRGLFNDTGKLDNTQDTGFRAINEFVY